MQRRERPRSAGEDALEHGAEERHEAEVRPERSVGADGHGAVERTARSGGHGEAEGGQHGAELKQSVVADGQRRRSGWAQNGGADGKKRERRGIESMR